MIEQTGTEYEVTPQQLKLLWEQNPELVVLDCREPEELRIASLPQARAIPMREIPGRLQELDPQKEMVVLCHHGMRSMNVVLWLRQQAGFTLVKSLRGGIDAWSQIIDPSIPRY